MRKIVGYFLTGILVMVVLTCLTGLSDDAFLKTGIWYKDIPGSFRYYIFWVLPYWWLIILIASLLFGTMTYTIKMGIKNFKWKKI